MKKIRMDKRKVLQLNGNTANWKKMKGMGWIREIEQGYEWEKRKPRRMCSFSSC